MVSAVSENQVEYRHLKWLTNYIEATISGLKVLLNNLAFDLNSIK